MEKNRFTVWPTWYIITTVVMCWFHIILNKLSWTNVGRYGQKRLLGFHCKYRETGEFEGKQFAGMPQGMGTVWVQQPIRVSFGIDLKIRIMPTLTLSIVPPADLRLLPCKWRADAAVYTFGDLETYSLLRASRNTGLGLSVKRYRR